jgi:hypothetical protein
MAHQAEFANVLARQAVIAFLYSECVIPDDSGYADLLVQVLVPLAGV